MPEHQMIRIARGTAVMFRRFVFLLLGGILALPYIGMVAVFIGVSSLPSNRLVPISLLLVGGVALGIIPPFLATVRLVEIAASRSLLGVNLPLPTAESTSWLTRWRAALWFAIHLLAGSATGFAMVLGLPTSVLLLMRGLGDEPAPSAPLLTGLTGIGAVVGAAVVAVLVAALIIALGAMLPPLARMLLGPDRTDRLRELELERRKAAERNRLARELHDSIGHALTITTLQAAAARTLIDSDPEFAEQALVTIEQTGRTAVDQLDLFLGMLRDDTLVGGADALEGIGDLVEDVRAAGARVALHVSGELSGLPPQVSRESFGVLRESITNAIRHGSGEISVKVSRTADALQLVVENPLTATPRAPRTGQGLSNIRERVALMCGDVTIGNANEGWAVTASIPLDGRHT
jgi:signal transduction histidine kinase